MASIGRPRLLTPELMEKAESYLTQWEAIGDKVPSIESFALYVGIARTTVYAWSNENDEFSYIVERVNAGQARELMNRSLSGELNASISKLLLHKHGHSEKSEVINTMQGPNGEALKAEWVMAPLTKPEADE